MMRNKLTAYVQARLVVTNDYASDKSNVTITYL